MIGYHYIEDETDETLAAAEASGLRRTVWFPPGNMRNESCWMYNHKSKENLVPGYPHYREDRAVQEIDPIKLWACADAVIRRAGWEGPTQYYGGPLITNYEDFTCITHPGPQQNLPPEESYENHLRLVRYMRARYPMASLGTWGLPMYTTAWGEYSLLGHQRIAMLTLRHDIGAASCYQLGRDSDAQHTIDRLAWYASTGLPLIVYVSPWERHRAVHGGDNKWHYCPIDKQRSVLDAVSTTTHVVGIEMWSMVSRGYIRKGYMAPEITVPAQIEDHHVQSLMLMADYVN